MTLTFPSNPVTGTISGNYIFDGVKWVLTSSSSGPSDRLVNGNYIATLDSSGVFTTPGDATITGNLTVSGTALYVNGSNTVYTDNLIELHAPSGGTGGTWTSNDGKDIGFRFHYYDTSDKNAALVLAQDTGYLEWYKSGTETNGIFSGTYGTFKSAGMVLTSTGSITFPDATVQTTAWTGTASAGTLSGTTLNATVVNSSLTSIGTLADLTVTNIITGSISGNAATVTNGVYTTGSYTNPVWISSLAYSKITSAPTNVTINGNAITLGGSGTIKASTTNALTIGTGLTGTSFDGGSAVTVAIGSDVATLSGTQSFTGTKTFQAGSVGLKITGTSSTTDSMVVVGRTDGTGSYTQTLSTSSLTTDRTATFPNASGNVVIDTASQTLTNKTISGSSNTITNIANSSLTNSAITINGTAISLGGSGTIAAIISNALSIGTGLTGTSYDGSSAVTIAIGSDVATLSGTQSFTGTKTFQAGSVGLKITGTSSTTDSIVIVGRTAGTGSYTQTLATSALSASRTSTFPDASGNVVIDAASQTLTNKTISGSSNTISNLANSALTNSAITINGTAISLGGSGTIAASTTNALTIGTGLTGTSFNGSSAVTIAIGSDVVTLTGTQSLTNKTITATALYGTQSAISAGVIDLTLGNYFSKTITAITTFSVSNVAASGIASSFILDLTNGGAFTITWWSGMKWVAATPPVLTASGRDVLGFFTYNAGTTWTGLLLSKDVR